MTITPNSGDGSGALSGLFDVLTNGVNAWGAAALAKEQAKQPVIYTASPYPGSGVYPAGAAQLSTVGQASAAGATWLPVLLLGGAALVVVLMVMRR